MPTQLANLVSGKCQVIQAVAHLDGDHDMGRLSNNGITLLTESLVSGLSIVEHTGWWIAQADYYIGGYPQVHSGHYRLVF